MCNMLKQRKKVKEIRQPLQGGAGLQLVLRWGSISSEGDAMDVALGLDSPEELSSV